MRLRRLGLRPFGLRPRLLGALVLTAVVTLAVAALALLSPLEHRLQVDGENTVLAAVSATSGRVQRRARGPEHRSARRERAAGTGLRAAQAGRRQRPGHRARRADANRSTPAPDLTPTFRTTTPTCAGPWPPDAAATRWWATSCWSPSPSTSAGAALRPRRAPSAAVRLVSGPRGAQRLPGGRGSGTGDRAAARHRAHDARCCGAWSACATRPASSSATAWRPSRPPTGAATRSAS